MDEAASATIAEPLDLVKLALGEKVFVKLRGDRTLSGILHAYDAHMNLVMSGVEESIHVVDVTEDGNALPPRIERRNVEMLFVRGDGVILHHHDLHVSDIRTRPFIINQKPGYSLLSHSELVAI